MPVSIYVADDEPALLNAVEQEVPDLVLLDIMMPGRTGLETLEAIRKKPQDTVVVILTAYRLSGPAAY